MGANVPDGPLAHNWDRVRTEANTWADGGLGEQDRTPPARDFFCQAAEPHQAGIGSIKHVAGHHLAVDHTQGYGCVGHLWDQRENSQINI